MDLEKIETYAVYAFVVIAFVLVAMVGWGFTHGG
jgi:hypothetical protein